MARIRDGRLFRRILHPSDFSAASRPAFRHALELAKASGAYLLVAHVLPVVPLVPDAYIVATTYDALQRAQRASGQKQLGRLVRTATAAGVRASGVLLDVGGPAERLTQLAKSSRADVIVMGTHGRTGLKHMLLGNVAEKVVRLAP